MTQRQAVFLGGRCAPPGNCKRRKLLMMTIKIAALILLLLPGLAARGDLAGDQKSGVNLEKLDNLLLVIAAKGYFPELGKDWTYQKAQSAEPAVNDLVDLINLQHGNTGNLGVIEQRLVKFLNSEASLPGKQFACKCLRIIGTEQSVSTLATMLTNSDAGEMARFALEKIPGEVASQALRDALGKTSGKAKAGIINSLAHRMDGKCVDTFANLLRDSEVVVALAAADALGQIADARSVQALEQGRGPAKDALRTKICNSYLKCAENFAAQGETKKALEIYRQVFDPHESGAVRAAALRGMAKNSEAETAETIKSALLDKSPVLQEAVMDCIRWSTGRQIAAVAVAAFFQLTAEWQVQLISALAMRGGPEGLAVVNQATKSEFSEIRIEAFKALEQLGNNSSIEVLAQSASMASGEEQEIARRTLYRIPGKNIDADIVAGIENTQSPQAPIRTEFIAAVGQRKIVTREAIAALFGAAKNDADAKLRIASLKSLGMVAGAGDVPSLLEFIIAPRSENESQAAEGAVVAITQRIPDKNTRSETIIERTTSIEDTAARCRLLAVLGRIGGSNALDQIRKNLDDSHAGVQKACILATSEWPDPAPMGDLLKIIKTSNNDERKRLALSGYITLIGNDPDKPLDQVVRLYRDAMGMAFEVAEKKMVLSNVGAVKSPLALQFTAEYLDDKELSSEAQAAAVRISEATYRGDAQLTHDTLNEVIRITSNDSLRRRAQEILTWK